MHARNPNLYTINLTAKCSENEKSVSWAYYINVLGEGHVDFSRQKSTTLLKQNLNVYLVLIFDYTIMTAYRKHINKLFSRPKRPFISFKIR